MNVYGINSFFVAVARWKIETDRRWADFSGIMEGRSKIQYLNQKLNTFEKNGRILKNGGDELNQYNL